jgi:hypothetical protein
MWEKVAGSAAQDCARSPVVDPERDGTRAARTAIRPPSRNAGMKKTKPSGCSSYKVEDWKRDKSMAIFNATLGIRIFRD